MFIHKLILCLVTNSSKLCSAIVGCDLKWFLAYKYMFEFEM